MMMHFQKRTAAFTLIELMLVIMISIIILGWGLPNFLRSFEKQGIVKASFDVLEGCNQARAYSILSGKTAELIIRAGDGQMSIREAQGPRLIRHWNDHEILQNVGDQTSQNEDQNAQNENQNAETQKALAFKKSLEDEVSVEMIDVNFIDQMQFPEAIVRFFPNGTSDEFTIVLRIEDEWRKITLDPICGVARLEDLQNLQQ